MPPENVIGGALPEPPQRWNHQAREERARTAAANEHRYTSASMRGILAVDILGAPCRHSIVDSARHLNKMKYLSSRGFHRAQQFRHFVALLLLCFGATGSRCLAAYTGPLPDDPITYPVYISHITGGTGSGVYMRISNSVYLATARHVLFQQDRVSREITTNLVSSNATLVSFSLDTNKVKTKVTVSIDILQAFTNGMLRFSTNRDVALLKIGTLDENAATNMTPLPFFAYRSQNHGINLFSSSNISYFDEIAVGRPVFVFGYPTAITSGVSAILPVDEPLLRSGVIAGLNDERRSIVLDCPVYGGNSGGPALQVEDQVLSKRFTIIGLVSSAIQFREIWENHSLKYYQESLSNSGYSLVEPIGYAIALAWE